MSYLLSNPKVTYFPCSVFTQNVLRLQIPVDDIHVVKNLWKNCYYITFCRPCSQDTNFKILEINK